MRVSKWMIAAPLLVWLSAFAQTVQPTQASQSVQPGTSAASAPGNTPPAAPAQQAQAPSTMDQVVDRIILRERGLIDMLKTRTPIVETYLQNLQWDAQLGPVPKDDRYFLGRVDLTESIDRKSYLQDESMEKHLLGGVTKYFKMQYQPLGFSWMLFADRNDFDKAHYEFLCPARVSGRCSHAGVRHHAKERHWERTLSGTHLGRRPGLQHCPPERHLCSAPA